MKIAVMFGGRLDDFDKNYENIKKQICQDNDVDFFLSSGPELCGRLDEFMKLYKPKAINIEAINHTFDYTKFKCTLPRTDGEYTVSCHWYNKRRVFELVEKYQKTHNVTYDMYISTRLDLFFHSPLNYLELREKIGQNGIIISSEEDVLAVGNASAMKQYMDCYTNIHHLLCNGVPFHPETLMMHHLRMINLPIIQFNNFRINRDFILSRYYWK
jgi:hypothetical protein